MRKEIVKEEIRGVSPANLRIGLTLNTCCRCS